MDRPLAGGFGGLTGPFRAEGCSGGSAAAKKIQRPAGVIINAMDISYVHLSCF